jgi:acyl-CoA thioesterase YciA
MLREGRTSMMMDVAAWVRRQPSGNALQVTEARFVFVAIDENGVKRPLPEETA